MFTPLDIETWILFSAAVGLAWYYIHRKWQYLKQLNIPHDPPSIWNIGHLSEAFGKTKSIEYDNERKRKYGPIWGWYSFTSPIITIHDPDILRQIFIKEFHNFPDRTKQLNKVNGKEMNTSLTSTSGAQWKRIRTTMTPSFSTAKLKLMAGAVEWCTDNAIEALNRKLENANGTFSAKDVFSRLSLDIVCSTAFGTRVNSQDDAETEPEISKQAKKIFSSSFFSPWVMLCVLFPPFEDLVAKLNISLFGGKAMEYFKNLTHVMLKRREEESDPHAKGQRVDFMQLMLDARISDEQVKQGAIKGLTKTEISGNSLLIILAGYENTGSTMSFLAYNLSQYPDVQTELQKDIDEMMKSHGKFDYEGVGSLKLLDMCISETLRLYCPVLRVSRFCENDITINGLNIPKGAQVNSPTFGLARDPDYWESPQEFRPERFRDASQIDNMVYQPFGAGPRNCIGMRFALMEIKMSMAKMLYNFTFVPAKDTPKPPLQVCFVASVCSTVSYDLRVVPRKRD